VDRARLARRPVVAGKLRLVSDALLIVSIPGKGRGVLAGRRFAQDELIERAPVVVLSAAEWEIAKQTDVARYSFCWGRRGLQAGIALGTGSLFNHSYSPNAFARPLVGERLMEFVALRDIEEKEEITINYNGEPDDRRPVGFRVRK
jgi:hypothetical protein